MDKYIADTTPKRGKRVIHGRPSTYNNHSCRCEPCTEAWASYQREGGGTRKFRERNPGIQKSIEKDGEWLKQWKNYNKDEEN